MDTKTACKIARALDGVSEKDHFGSDAFYANGRIFATVWHDKGEVNLRLSLDQQQHFLEKDGEGFVEIKNGFGKMGWTTAVLEFLERADFAEALKAAWEESAVKRATKKKTATKKKKT